MRDKKVIGVIGGGRCPQRIAKLAETVGREIAKRDALLICGGLGGVMEAACRGAKQAKGMTIGILPGADPHEANEYVDVAIATGLGIARNVIIIRSCDAVIAIDGQFGTLSEIAFALQLGKPVVGLETWEISELVLKAKSPKEAVELAFQEITKK